MINLQHSNTKAYTIALLGLGLITLLYHSAGAVAYVLLGLSDRPETLLIVQGGLQLLIMLGLTMLIASKSSMNSQRIFNLRQFPSLSQIVVGLIGLIGLLIFQTGYDVVQEMMIPESLKPVYEELIKIIEDMYAQLLLGNGLFQIILSIIVIAIIPAFSEEFLFRGFVQNAFEYDFSAAKSIILTSLLFGLMHMNPIGFVSLTVIGVFLGICSYSTRTLWLPIIVHFANNVTAYIAMSQSDMVELEQSAADLDFGSALTMMLVGIIVIVFASHTLLKTKTPNHF